MHSRPDELWMEEALRDARQAESMGEVPVGAIVVYEERVIARAGNRNLADYDPTAHAEILALRQAGRALGNHRLLRCTMYATVEPCAMCAGAMVHARLQRLVYGADDPKAGAAGSTLQVLNHAALNHRMEVTRGVLASRCMDLLQNFFRRKRESGSASE